MSEHFTPERDGHGRREEDCGGVCPSHSGLVTGNKGLYALLGILITLLGGQMMFQIPAIKIDILNEVKGITARIVELEKTDIQFKNDIAEIKGRVTDIERAVRK